MYVGGSRFLYIPQSYKNICLLCRKHASEDLQPYTCYLSDCPRNHPFFNTFDDWKAHVLSKSHQNFEGWTCLICQFTAGTSQETVFLKHLEHKHSDSVAKKSREKFATMCRKWTAPALDQCPVCSIHEKDWKIQKEVDSEFELNVTTFLEHIGQCLHYFAIKVLPDTEPEQPDKNSTIGPTIRSLTENRSWLSFSLTVSHHTESGLAESDFNNFPQAKLIDKVYNVLRIQGWVEMATNMDDPNSNDAARPLEPISKRPEPEHLPIPTKETPTVSGSLGKEPTVEFLKQPLNPTVSSLPFLQIIKLRGASPNKVARSRTISVVNNREPCLVNVKRQRGHVFLYSHTEHITGQL